MDVKELLKAELEKASLYGTLAKYYEYQNPELHCLYYRKHYDCVCKIVDCINRYGDPYDCPPPYVSGPGPALPLAYPGKPAPAAYMPSVVLPQANMPYRGPSQPYLDPATTMPRVRDARLRVLHPSPDAPSVDVYANGRMVVANLPYKKITGYVSVPAGEYRLDIYPAGQKDTPIRTETVTLEPGASYTVAAAGKMADLDLLLYMDDPVVPPGKAMARFIHLSPDAPVLNIAVRSGGMLFPTVPFKGANVLTPNPMTGDLEVRAADTNQALLALPQVTFEPGRSYTIIAVGLLKGTPGLEMLLLVE